MRLQDMTPKAPHNASPPAQTSIMQKYLSLIALDAVDLCNQTHQLGDLRISKKTGKCRNAYSHQLQLACIHSKSFLTPFF